MAPTRKDAEKRERLSVRLSASQKGLLQHAADIEGSTVSEFLRAHTLEAARRTIGEHAILRLSERDSLVFAQALLAPWEPGADLHAEARRMRDLLGGA